MAAAAQRSWFIRLLLSLGAGAGSAVLVAVGVAIVDIYLTGHGMTPLNRPLLDWPAAGIHLGVGDVLLLGAVVFAAAVTWRRTAGGGASHADMFSMQRKLGERADAKNPVDPFIDRAGYLGFIDRAEDRFRKALADQQR